MMAAYQVIAAVLFLIVMVREGLTLNCSVCNSFVTNACNDDPLTFTQECPVNATSCRKMEQEIFYDKDYQVRTIRQCAMESGPMRCIERTGTYRFKVFYCHCDEGDNCNSASSLYASVALALFSTGALAFIKL